LNCLLFYGLGTKFCHKPVIYANGKFDGVATNLTVLNKNLLANAKIDEFGLFFKTIRTGKITIEHGSILEIKR